MIIFVLHGFQGATPNRKTQVLDKHAKEFDIVGINYTYNPDNAYDEIVTQMEDAFTFYDTRQCAFLGTSLGAFWARFIAQDYGMLGILINPALDPLESLKSHVGMCKNSITNGAFELHDSDVALYKEFYVNIEDDAKLLVLLDKGDKLFDYSITEELFRDTQEVITFEDGDHSFAHLKDALSDIKRFCNEVNDETE